MDSNPGMKNLVLTVNKLQETFKSLEVPMDIDLPQIAVVGIQSSGKSSVLEKFVGRDFLPRGSGIVTRRPLILQLITNPNEYAKFDHSPTTFTDFKKVMKEIEDETDRVTGTKKGISNKPIILKIFSPNVLNLTLIDLPGMTKVPIGDQPTDIEHQIRSMILEFIEKETCLILAVTPANMDLANSDSLKLAKEVDPHGRRTIGVITKLDLMDRGTNALDVLENKIFPLSRGYIGVVNRSQKDIDDKLDMTSAAKEEMKFFTNNSVYRHMAHRMGTQHLQKVLNEQLTNHIRETLPVLKGKIREQYEELREEIQEIGDDNPKSHSKIMMEIIQHFRHEFEGEIDGYGNTGVNTRELTFGYEINRVYNERLPLDTFRSNFSEQSERELYQEILCTIRNINGINTNLFMSDKAFEGIVKFHIEQMKKPVIKYVDLITAILMNIIRKYTDKIIKYPRLRDEMKAIAVQHIKEREILCKERLIEMIDCEMAYINKRHEDFIMGEKKSMTKREKPVIERKPVIVKKDDNSAVYKGYMSVQNSITADKYWFVLSLYSLQGFRDENETDREFLIPLEKLRLTDNKGKSFKIFHTEGKIIYKDSNSIRLACRNSDEVRAWVERFGSVGVVQSSMSRFYGGQDMNGTASASQWSLVERDVDTVEVAQVTASASTNKSGEANEEAFSVKAGNIEQQVEMIKQLAESYLKIVVKGIKDRIPKIITFLIINSTRKFIDGKMLTHFYQNDLVTQVMQKSPDVALRNARAKEMFKACQEALRIIDDNLMIS